MHMYAYAPAAAWQGMHVPMQARGRISLQNLQQLQHVHKSEVCRCMQVCTTSTPLPARAYIYIGHLQATHPPQGHTTGVQ